MNDRRRINGPPGGSVPPVYASILTNLAQHARPQRTRPADLPRKIFLKTGLTPSAPGSAYFELEAAPSKSTQSLIPSIGSLKLTCTVHGPRPLARSTAYSSHLVLSTYVKFAPFASRVRRGYVRDVSERDLGAHLETALRGVIIGDRWPKSGVDVIVTILEGEEDEWWGDAFGNETDDKSARTGIGGCGMLTVLAGCISVASAALVDAGIDCVDVLAGGVAALVRDPTGMPVIVRDPCPAEHREVLAACAAGYLATRDELTELWVKGAAGDRLDDLVDEAVHAASATRSVLVDAITEGVQAKLAVPSSDTMTVDEK